MLRAVADHLGRDADGDLLRRFSQDRQTDGRVNAVDVLLREARRGEPFTRERDLLPAADAADVGCRRAKHLL